MTLFAPANWMAYKNVETTCFSWMKLPSANVILILSRFARVFFSSNGSFIKYGVKSMFDSSTIFRGTTATLKARFNLSIT